MEVYKTVVSEDGIEFDFRDGKIIAIRFPANLKLPNECPEISFVTNKFVEKDIVYVKLKKKPNQEYSSDVSELNDEIIIDFDERDRVVGVAFLNLELLPQPLIDIVTKKMTPLPSSYSNLFTSMPVGNGANDRSQNGGDNEEEVLKKPHRSQKERTPFMIACCTGNIDQLNELYEKSDNKNDLLTEKDRQGSSPFLLAASYGQIEVSNWLLSKSNGIFNNEPRHDGQTACIQAASHGHISFLEYMINDCHFPVSILNLTDKTGDSALMHASGNGHLSTVEWLFSNGADLFQVSNSKSAALQRAVVGGHMDMVKWLIEKGLDINSMTEKGLTCLHYAIKNEKVDILLYLLDHGAIIQSDVKGLTPIDYAKQVTPGNANGKVEFLKIFADRNLS